MTESISKHIKTLESFGSRYCTRNGNGLGQGYIERCLREYGYPVRRAFAEFEGRSYASPWAWKIGSRGSAGRQILLAAHFDSISYNAKGDLLPQAPGADDDASGVAVLLEAARMLAGQTLPHSLCFVFFNLEEVGMVASRQFAKDWKMEGRRLDGVINIDGIGTWPVSLAQGGKVNYVTNEASRPWMATLQRHFGLPLKPADTPWEDDHASFWAEGFPAIELTEEGCTPFMHTSGDTSEKVDMRSVAGVAEALVGMLKRLE
jgi:Zn-dependent M28 family amino/carboxypeptidase